MASYFNNDDNDFRHYRNLRNPDIDYDHDIDSDDEMDLEKQRGISADMIKRQEEFRAQLEEYENSKPIIPQPQPKPTNESRQRDLERRQLISRRFRDQLRKRDEVKSIRQNAPDLDEFIRMDHPISIIKGTTGSGKSMACAEYAERYGSKIWFAVPTRFLAMNLKLRFKNLNVLTYTEVAHKIIYRSPLPTMIMLDEAHYRSAPRVFVVLMARILNVKLILISANAASLDLPTYTVTDKFQPGATRKQPISIKANVVEYLIETWLPQVLSAFKQGYDKSAVFYKYAAIFYMPYWIKDKLEGEILDTLQGYCNKDDIQLLNKETRDSFNSNTEFLIVFSTNVGDTGHTLKVTYCFDPCYITFSTFDIIKRTTRMVQTHTDSMQRRGRVGRIPGRDAYYIYDEPTLKLEVYHDTDDPSLWLELLAYNEYLILDVLDFLKQTPETYRVYQCMQLYSFVIEDRISEDIEWWYGYSQPDRKIESFYLKLMYLYFEQQSDIDRKYNGMKMAIRFSEQGINTPFHKKMDLADYNLLDSFHDFYEIKQLS